MRSIWAMHSKYQRKSSRLRDTVGGGINWWANKYSSYSCFYNGVKNCAAIYCSDPASFHNLATCKEVNMFSPVVKSAFLYLFYRRSLDFWLFEIVGSITYAVIFGFISLITGLRLKFCQYHNSKAVQWGWGFVRSQTPC